VDAGEQTNNSQTANIESRLWQFAVALYSRPEVAKACLDAQERWGVDVNLVLSACWCASEGHSLAADDFLRAQARCEAWRDAIILPLRKQRQHWHKLPDKSDEYAAIKALELQAERTQLELLATLFEEIIQSDLDVVETERHTERLTVGNLRSLAQHYKLSEAVFASFLDALHAA